MKSYHFFSIQHSLSIHNNEYEELMDTYGRASSSARPKKLNGLLQERVKWGFEPPSVGLPFDWHLPTNRLERAAAAKLEAKGLKGEAKACVPFQPSTHSPYALVCFTGSEALKEMIVQKPA